MAQKLACSDDGASHLSSTKWSADEVALIRDRYSSTPAKVLAAQLGRSYQAVMKKASALGVARPAGVSQTPHRWTASDDAEFIAMYPEALQADVAARFGITERAAYARAFKLGVKRESRARHCSALGTERLHRGVLERKVAATGVRKLDWKRVEVIEWEEVNGPVPAGYLLVKPRNVERHAEALQLIRLEEMPLAAARALAPVEVRELINIKASFGRQLSRIEQMNGVKRDSARESYRPWSNEDTAFLIENRSCLTPVGLAAALNRTLRAIDGRLRRLGLRSSGGSSRAWTAAEEGLLKQQFNCIGAAEVAAQIGRTTRSVEAKAERLRLKIPRK